MSNKQIAVKTVIPELTEFIKKKDVRIVSRLATLKDGLKTIMEFKDFITDNKDFFLENIDELKNNL